MIQIENLPIVLTGIGIIVSILYYTSVLRNTSKSRQIQVISSVPTPTDWRWMDWQYKDFDQFTSDYGPEINPDGWAQFFLWSNRLKAFGVYVREGLLDIRLVCLLSGGTITSTWEKFKPFFIEWRSRYNRPRGFIEAEYLYSKVVEYFKKHPELAP